MNIIKTAIKIFIILATLLLIYGSYYFFVSMPADQGFTNILNALQMFKNKLSGQSSNIDQKIIDDQVNKQPASVTNNVATAVDDLKFMIDYSNTHNIKIPEEINTLIRNEETFIASAKLKEHLSNELVGLKDLIIVQVTYQDHDEVSTNLLKQKSYAALNTFTNNVLAGRNFDTEILNLKKSVNENLVNVQYVKDYDCSSSRFNEHKDVKDAADKIKSGEFSQFVDKAGFSYLVIYASKANDSVYCSFDEFYKANKK